MNNNTDPRKRLMAPINDGHDSPAILPEGMGGKFTPDGKIQSWHGTTFVCHVPRDSEAWLTLCALQDRLKSGPVAHKFAWLAPTSFHMTLFGGVSGPRRAGQVWPDGVPPDLGYPEVAAILARRTRGITIPTPLHVAASRIWAGIGLTVQGVSDTDQAAIRQARTELREATRINDPNFDDYVLHISLTYQLATLTSGETDAHLIFLAEVEEMFLPDLQNVTLGPAELCVFENMQHFEPVQSLAGPCKTAGQEGRDVL